MRFKEPGGRSHPNLQNAPSGAAEPPWFCRFFLVWEKGAFLPRWQSPGGMLPGNGGKAFSRQGRHQLAFLPPPSHPAPDVPAGIPLKGLAAALFPGGGGKCRSILPGGGWQGLSFLPAIWPCSRLPGLLPFLRPRFLRKPGTYLPQKGK